MFGVRKWLLMDTISFFEWSKSMIHFCYRVRRLFVRLLGTCFLQGIKSVVVNNVQHLQQFYQHPCYWTWYLNKRYYFWSDILTPTANRLVQCWGNIQWYSVKKNGCVTRNLPYQIVIVCPAYFDWFIHWF